MVNHVSEKQLIIISHKSSWKNIWFPQMFPPQPPQTCRRLPLFLPLHVRSSFFHVPSSPSGVSTPATRTRTQPDLILPPDKPPIIWMLKLLLLYSLLWINRFQPPPQRLNAKSDISVKMFRVGNWVNGCRLTRLGGVITVTMPWALGDPGVRKMIQSPGCRPPSYQPDTRLHIYIQDKNTKTRKDKNTKKNNKRRQKVKK